MKSEKVWQVVFEKYVLEVLACMCWLGLMLFCFFKPSGMHAEGRNQVDKILGLKMFKFGFLI